MFRELPPKRWTARANERMSSFPPNCATRKRTVLPDRRADISNHTSNTISERLAYPTEEGDNADFDKNSSAPAAIHTASSAGTDVRDNNYLSRVPNDQRPNLKVPPAVHSCRLVDLPPRLCSYAESHAVLNSLLRPTIPALALHTRNTCAPERMNGNGSRETDCAELQVAPPSQRVNCVKTV